MIFLWPPSDFSEWVFSDLPSDFTPLSALLTLNISFILCEILLSVSVTPLCLRLARMTPAHVINNLTSINLANLLRLMSCVSESLTTSLCSIFWIVKASARPFRSTSFNSDLCGASELYFYFVLICGSGLKSCATRGFFAGDSCRLCSEDPTCRNLYLCVNCTTPFVNVDSIVFLNILRLGKRHAFGVWMTVPRKDHLKVKHNIRNTVQFITT